MSSTTKHLPPLLAHVWDHAGLMLLGTDTMPQRLANRRPPSPERCLIVLLYLASMARIGDASRGQLAYSAETIGRETGLQRAAVQDALYALEHLGLIVPTGGGKGRAKRYLVLPDVVTAARQRESVVESVPESVVESVRTHYVGGDRDKGGDGASAPPPACPNHPNGPHHGQPCRTCADVRRWQQGQPTATPPAWDTITEQMAHPCAHGTPGGNPRNCVFCRRPALHAVGAMP